MDFFGHGVGASLLMKLAISQYQLLTQYNVRNVVLSCPTYLTKEHVTSEPFQGLHSFMQMNPLRGMRLWPLKFVPDFTNNRRLEMSWRNNQYYNSNNLLQVSSLDALLNLVKENGSISDQMFTICSENMIFNIVIVGAGKHSLMNRDMAFELYKKLNLYMKERVTFLDWEGHSSEPYTEPGYSSKIDEIIQTLI
tara:strand:- start:132 stop:713 length:582 start_codon:yes stop_codon:yes gene_type:complete